MPSTKKQEPTADRQAFTAASGDQKHPKPFEKGCFPERLISTLPECSIKSIHVHGPLQPNDAPAEEEDAFSPGVVGKERRTEVSPTPAWTTRDDPGGQNISRIPRGQEQFSVAHRQLGSHLSASDTWPVTPVTSKSQPSIFYSSKPSKQTLSIQTQPKSTARCCFQLRPRLHIRLSASSAAGISPTGTRGWEATRVPPTHPMKQNPRGSRHLHAQFGNTRGCVSSKKQTG